jgi:hypothetical protein
VNPILAALLPLLITLGLTLTALLMVGVFSLTMFARVARGELEPEPDDESETE